MASGPTGLKSDASDVSVERGGEVEPAEPGDSCGSSDAAAGQAGSPGEPLESQQSGTAWLASGGRGNGGRLGTSGDSGSSSGSPASTAADSSDAALAKGRVPQKLTPGARSRCDCGSRNCNGRCGFGGSRRDSARVVWRMKTREEFEREEDKKEEPPRQRWNFGSLEQMVAVVPLSSDLPDAVRAEEQDRRRGLAQLLDGLLRLQPEERWTPSQALRHPFLLGTPYCEDFRPPPSSPVPPPLEVTSTACTSGASVSTGSRVLRASTAKIPLPKHDAAETYRPNIVALERELCGTQSAA